MITITRRVARQLRAVFRPQLLGIPPSGPPPLLTFRAGRGLGLRVRFAAERLAVECTLPWPPRPREAVVLPMDLLEKIQAREDSPVTLQDLGAETLVSWGHEDLDPQWARVAVPHVRSLPLFPRLPSDLARAPVDLLDLLAEASEGANGGVIRIALGSGNPAVEGTARLTLPVRFEPPWRGEVVVPATPAYAAVARQNGPGLWLARTPTHLVLRRGAWSMWLSAIPAEPEPES